MHSPETGRRHAVSALELAREVALILDADSRHDLLNAEQRSLQQLLGALKSELAQVTRGSHPCFRLEQVLEARRRQPDGVCQLAI